MELYQYTQSQLENLYQEIFLIGMTEPGGETMAKWMMKEMDYLDSESPEIKDIHMRIYDLLHKEHTKEIHKEFIKLFNIRKELMKHAKVINPELESTMDRIRLWHTGAPKTQKEKEQSQSQYK